MIKNFENQNRSILEGVFEIKKKVVNRDLKTKDLKLGTRRGPSGTPPPGDKFVLSVRGRVFDFR